MTTHQSQERDAPKKEKLYTEIREILNGYKQGEAWCLERTEKLIKKCVSQYRQELEGEVEKGLDEYFKGLILMPDPQASLPLLKDHLLSIIRESGDKKI